MGATQSENSKPINSSQILPDGVKLEYCKTSNCSVSTTVDANDTISVCSGNDDTISVCSDDSDVGSMIGKDELTHQPRNICQWQVDGLFNQGIVSAQEYFHYHQHYDYDDFFSYCYQRVASYQALTDPVERGTDELNGWRAEPTFKSKGFKFYRNSKPYLMIDFDKEWYLEVWNNDNGSQYWCILSPSKDLKYKQIHINYLDCEQGIKLTNLDYLKDVQVSEGSSPYHSLKYTMSLNMATRKYSDLLKNGPIANEIRKQKSTANDEIKTSIDYTSKTLLTIDEPQVKGKLQLLRDYYKEVWECDDMVISYFTRIICDDAEFNERIGSETSRNNRMRKDLKNYLIWSIINTIYTTAIIVNVLGLK